MSLARRHFLSAALAAPFWGSVAEAAGRTEGGTLVVLFLRGGLDGLSAVAPMFEEDLFRGRPTLAVPRGEVERLGLGLDGRFAFHPALAPLRSVFDSGELALVHAVGSTLPTRSHFDAQDQMDFGQTDDSDAAGWLGRLDHVLSPSGEELQSVALENKLPVSLWGASDALALGRLPSFQYKRSTREERWLALARTLASGSHRPEGRQLEATLRLLERVGQIHRMQAGRSLSTPYARGELGSSLFDLASLLRAGARVRVATLSSSGWDSHTGQTGMLDRSLSDLAQNLRAFRADLGPRFREVTVLCCTEFGRTVKENGTGGTDHGTGSVFFVLGGGIRGGEVYGRWPGLDSEHLMEGRDLAVTTDFRDVFWEVARSRFALPETAHARLFPGHSPRPVGLVPGGTIAEGPG